ncbi:MAG: diphosphatase [Rhodocyclaceae bacterium]|nr:diphosphatase [Rhodocyclaceae bacterium]
MTPDPYVFAPSYGPPHHTGPSLVFAFVGDKLVIGPDNRLPTAAPLGMSRECSETLVFGSLNGLVCELRVWPAATALPSGLGTAHYRQLWGQWEQGQLDALCRAQQLATWIHQNRFCGVCGQPLRTRPDEPARECGACGFRAYPRISPVCIGLVLKGDEVLLARSPHFPAGVYSALAGYLEAGETAEECLRREIREEAGIEIDNIRWFGSQAWPYPHSLMMGFFADYAAGEIRPQAGEIEDLQWFGKDRLPTLPHPSTIAFRMLDLFYGGLVGSHRT